MLFLDLSACDIDDPIYISLENPQERINDLLFKQLIYAMASNDEASQLEKGLPVSSSFSDPTFKESPTESTDTDTTLTERARFYNHCKYQQPGVSREILNLLVKSKIFAAIHLVRSIRLLRKDPARQHMSETKVRRRKPPAPPKSCYN